ncbi:Outer dense fiber protein 3-like protein 2, partial [Tritrichomonas musculus]
MSDPTQNTSPQEPIPIYILGRVEKPGPGTYNMQKDFVSDTTPINIHLKHNINEEVNQAPMMGSVDTMGEGPKYSIKGKYDIKTDPTPGYDYMPEPFGGNTTPITIHGKSNNLQPDDVPAPGTYDPNRPFGSDQQGST